MFSQNEGQTCCPGAVLQCVLRIPKVATCLTRDLSRSRSHRDRFRDAVLLILEMLGLKERNEWLHNLRSNRDSGPVSVLVGELGTSAVGSPQDVQIVENIIDGLGQRFDKSLTTMFEHQVGVKEECSICKEGNVRCDPFKVSYTQLPQSKRTPVRLSSEPLLTTGLVSQRDCTRCSTKNAVSTHLFLHGAPPPVMVIGVPRNRWSPTRNRTCAANNPVQYPRELTMTFYQNLHAPTDSDAHGKNVKFRLHSILWWGSDHFVSTVQWNDGWHVYDDDKPIQILKSVKETCGTARPCHFFYTRADSGLITNAQPANPLLRPSITPASFTNDLTGETDGSPCNSTIAVPNLQSPVNEGLMSDRRYNAASGVPSLSALPSPSHVHNSATLDHSESSSTSSSSAIAADPSSPLREGGVPVGGLIADEGEAPPAGFEEAPSAPATKKVRMQCRLCSPTGHRNSFISRKNMIRHVQRIHGIDVATANPLVLSWYARQGRPAEFHCGRCAKSYATEKAFREHMRNQHSENSGLNPTERFLCAAVIDRNSGQRTCFFAASSAFAMYEHLREEHNHRLVVQVNSLYVV